MNFKLLGVNEIDKYNYKDGRIIIEKREKTKDTSGYNKGFEITPINTCWCSIGQLSGQLQLQAINVKLENTALFTVRYLAVPKDLDSIVYKDKLYIVFDDRNYKVYMVDYHNNNKLNVTFKCMEVI